MVTLTGMRTKPFDTSAEPSDARTKTSVARIGKLVARVLPNAASVSVAAMSSMPVAA
ncbi:MAG TPA: hypothetical protein VGR59_13305 [Gemmatimonadaceae bacterium]|nr:hypothetical protein [Gemmatimonadaceae bacterium]